MLQREQKRAEEALRESQRQLSTLMANLPGIAYRGGNDRDWSMDFLSEGCYALTGYTPDELIKHKKVTYADLVHPDDREDLFNQVQAALRDKRLFQVEYRIRAKDGVEKWVWEQGCGVFGPDGDPQSLEGFITDISEQKRAEKEVFAARGCTTCHGPTGNEGPSVALVGGQVSTFSNYGPTSPGTTPVPPLISPQRSSIPSSVC